jgi:hypothetical protein
MAMRKPVATVVLFCIIGAAASATLATDDVHRFSGEAPGSTGAFRMEGPWTLAWTAASEFPGRAYLEMQLYDADTDRFIGLVAQRYGTGSGERLITEPGAYRIVVTGRFVDWSVRIEPAPENLAALAERRPDLRRIQLVEPDTGIAPRLVQDVASWRALGETAILLTTEDGARVRVPFHADASCPGLPESRNIFFVTAGFDAPVFNAIMLEDGTRCYLGTPTPYADESGPQ